MKKPHYGIDAPPVIKQLILMGIISLIIGVVAYVLLAHHNRVVALVILVVALIFTVINIAFTALMFWSSLFGKLIMRDRVVASLKLRGDEQVLDVGCGRGLLLNGIARQLSKDGSAVGIDLWRSEDLSDNREALTLENAQLEGVADRVRLISGDMTKMQIDDHHFDVIVSSMAIHNVSTADGRHKAIQEISRVLKPGGQLVILDFQHTKSYFQSLKELGWTNIQLSRRCFLMFPPVRLVTGIKSI